MCRRTFAPLVLALGLAAALIGGGDLAAAPLVYR